MCVAVLSIPRKNNADEKFHKSNVTLGTITKKLQRTKVCKQKTKVYKQEAKVYEQKIKVCTKESLKNF